MISQDRHEVYITIAEYDSKYVDYLNDKREEGYSLMQMNQFGPYMIDQGKDMTAFAEVVLALLHQNCRLS